MRGGCRVQAVLKSWLVPQCDGGPGGVLRGSVCIGKGELGGREMEARGEGIYHPNTCSDRTSHTSRSPLFKNLKYFKGDSRALN